MLLLGGAGELPAEVATPLALVLSELLQNSVEHGFRDRGGTVSVTLDRRAASLHLEVRDNGVGLPDGWRLETGANLGLQIASTLVESELGGTLEVRGDDEVAGTVGEAVLPLPR
jgi:two-component system, sensor histidine kinase PdtaS